MLNVRVSTTGMIYLLGANSYYSRTEDGPKLREMGRQLGLGRRWTGESKPDHKLSSSPDIKSISLVHSAYHHSKNAALTGWPRCDIADSD